MQVWSVTDIGMVRLENQDTCRLEKLSDGTMLAVVCDGMGGANAGGLAGSMAAEQFVAAVKAGWKKNLSSEQIEKLARSAVSAANDAVFTYGQEHTDCFGMGTTLVAAFLLGKAVSVVNVGDSRAYHIGEDGITKITVDHSLVEMMVQAGELTAEQARTHPKRNIITRAIGTEHLVEADVFHRPLAKGDVILLCTDGLTNEVTEQEILFEVLHGGKCEDCCHRLLEIAKTRGAPDNVTMILAQG